MIDWNRWLPDAASLGRVGVLMGGRSAEREVSLMSGGGVLQALREKGVDAHGFDPAERSLADLAAAGFDRVFIALHGRYGEDGTLQGALELLGIPYTGSGPLASSLAMDKLMTKRIWRHGGLPTPDWREPRNLHELEQACQALGTPMIVKPAHEGSTLGLTKVMQASQLPSAWALSSGLDTAVVAEQFIAGRELTVAVVQLGEQTQALPIIEIVAPGGQYDYDSKYFSDETRYLCPADLPEPLTQRIQAIVLEAFKQVGCEGWARADVMLRAGDQEPFLLEINTSPGMTGHSLVPMAARAAGLDYGDLCRLLLGQASLKVGRRGGAGA